MTVNNDERLEKFKAILAMENQILFDDPETLKLLDRFLKKMMQFLYYKKWDYV